MHKKHWVYLLEICPATTDTIHESSSVSSSHSSPNERRWLAITDEPCRWTNAPARTNMWNIWWLWNCQQSKWRHVNTQKYTQFETDSNCRHYIANISVVSVTEENSETGIDENLCIFVSVTMMMTKTKIYTFHRLGVWSPSQESPGVQVLAWSQCRSLSFEGDSDYVLLLDCTLNLVLRGFGFVQFNSQ